MFMCVNIESVKPCKVLRVALHLIFHQYNAPDSRRLFSRYFFSVLFWIIFLILGCVNSPKTLIRRFVYFIDFSAILLCYLKICNNTAVD